MPGAEICEVCDREFVPDPRVKDRQRVCQRLSCQLERKRRAQRAWVARNPGYFKQYYQDQKAKRDKKQTNPEHQGAKDESTPEKTIILNQALIHFSKDELTITIPSTNDLVDSLALWCKAQLNASKNNQPRRNPCTPLLTVKDKIGFFLPFVFLLPTELQPTGRKHDHG